MKIQIQILCDDPAEAAVALAKLTPQSIAVADAARILATEDPVREVETEAPPKEAPAAAPKRRGRRTKAEIEAAKAAEAAALDVEASAKTGATIDEGPFGLGEEAALPTKIADVVTMDDLRVALREALDTVGDGAVRPVFKKFGIAKLSDLTPDAYPKFIMALRDAKGLAS